MGLLYGAWLYQHKMMTSIFKLPEQSPFPRKFICRVSELIPNQPFEFEYLNQDLGKHFLFRTNWNPIEVEGKLRNLFAFNSQSIDGVKALVAPKELPIVEIKIVESKIYAVGIRDSDLRVKLS